MRKITAVIIGDRGQDGTLLRSSLEKQKVDIIGIGRDAVTPLIWHDKKFDANFSLLNPKHVSALLRTVQPREIYYLAAHHASAELHNNENNLAEYDKYHQTHVVGLLNFLSGIRIESPHSRLFYAASSLVFNGSNGPVQTESTPLSPVGFYGLTKAQGILLCREFRQKHGVYAASGILYNHESVYRNEKFLSKKLIAAAHRISLGLQSQLHLGNLSAESDWGFAPDFVEAFQHILRLQEADDFIIATGESHTVAEFAEIIFNQFGLNYKEYVREDELILGRRVPRKVGDFSKLQRATGWRPSCSFGEMGEKLAREFMKNQSSTI
jgi:GDPmannose 4,6-dehydratase